MGAIDKFYSIMSDKRVDGFARVARYEVRIHQPHQLGLFFPDSAAISLMCDSISMPGHDLKTESFKFGTGIAREMVTGHGYGDTIEATFYLDSQMDLKTYLDMWQELAIRTDKNVVNYYKDSDNSYRHNYVGSMEIFQLGSKEVAGGKAINRNTIGDYGQGAEGPRNENTRHEIHSVADRTYGIEVQEVYPATIGAIEYAYATVDEVAKLTVSFQYRKWEVINELAFS